MGRFVAGRVAFLATVFFEVTFFAITVGRFEGTACVFARVEPVLFPAPALFFATAGALLRDGFDNADLVVDLVGADFWAAQRLF